MNPLKSHFVEESRRDEIACNMQDNEDIERCFEDLEGAYEEAYEDIFWGSIDDGTVKWDDIMSGHLRAAAAIRAASKRKQQNEAMQRLAERMWADNSNWQSVIEVSPDQLAAIRKMAKEANLANLKSTVWYDQAAIDATITAMKDARKEKAPDLDLRARIAARMAKRGNSDTAEYAARVAERQKMLDD